MNPTQRPPGVIYHMTGLSFRDVAEAQYAGRLPATSGGAVLPAGAIRQKSATAHDPRLDALTAECDRLRAGLDAVTSAYVELQAAVRGWLR